MDSVIELPPGFFISKYDKFRNQRVWMVIEIPVGKKIGFSRDINDYSWFNVRARHNEWDYDDDDYGYRSNRPEPGQEYIMKADGHAEKITTL